MVEREKKRMVERKSERERYQKVGSEKKRVLGREY